MTSANFCRDRKACCNTTSTSSIPPNFPSSLHSTTILPLCEIFARLNFFSTEVHDDRRHCSGPHRHTLGILESHLPANTLRRSPDTSLDPAPSDRLVCSAAILSRAWEHALFSTNQDAYAPRPGSRTGKLSGLFGGRYPPGQSRTATTYCNALQPHPRPNLARENGSSTSYTRFHDASPTIDLASVYFMWSSLDGNSTGKPTLHYAIP